MSKSTGVASTSDIYLMGNKSSDMENKFSDIYLMGNKSSDMENKLMNFY